MRPELILGFDPAPADLEQVAALEDTLRTVVRAVAAARSRVTTLLGGGGPMWDGAAGAYVADLLQRFVRRQQALEETLVGVLRAVEDWERGVQARQEQAGQVVASVAGLAAAAGPEASAGRRSRLLAQARDVAEEHQQAAAVLRAAVERASRELTEIFPPDDDLPGDLNRALLGLRMAVVEWVEAEGPELLRTAQSLAEVVELTTVISELVGIAALDRSPAEAPGVGALVARSPASHRLVRALRRQWADLPAEALVDASFVGEQRSLADTIRTRTSLQRDRPAEPVIPQQSGGAGTGGSPGCG